MKALSCFNSNRMVPPVCCGKAWLVCRTSHRWDEQEHRLKPTSVLDFTDGVVAEFVKIPAARFPNLMDQLKPEKWRMLALKRDAQQSHKSVIIVDSPIFNCTVSICALFPTLIFSFQLAGFVSAQIKNKHQQKKTIRTHSALYMHW